VGILSLSIFLSGCIRYDKYKDIRYKDIPGVDPNLISLDIYVPEVVLKNIDDFTRNPKLKEIVDKMIDKYGREYNGINLPMPVMIWVHGGGWAKGDKDNQLQYKIPFFIDEGWIFVSVNYRLSPAETPDDPADFDANRIMYPVHNHDVAAAIAWVHEHISEYGGDPDQISIMGHSAGAGIVAGIGTNQTFLQEFGLNLSVLKNVICLDTEGYDILGQIENGSKIGRAHV
jgi:acetyl esterase/lipase